MQECIGHMTPKFNVITDKLVKMSIVIDTQKTPNNKVKHVGEYKL
jgi:hypothetical protein